MVLDLEGENWSTILIPMIKRQAQNERVGGEALRSFYPHQKAKDNLAHLECTELQFGMRPSPTNPYKPVYMCACTNAYFKYKYTLIECFYI